MVFSVIREYGSTLYVGLAHAVSPTNTNFRLTFLLTRLQEALYEDLDVGHRLKIKLGTSTYITCKPQPQNHKELYHLKDNLIPYINI